ncbi:hypothetical protein ILYODFUR_029884, partial [Ilyodon furcidens]
CPPRDEFPLIETEDKALLRRLRADIQQKDKEVLELLQERATLFSDLVQATTRGEAGEEKCVEVKTSSSNRNLFRADTPHAPKAEPLLLAAIGEVDKLTALLSESSTQRSSVTNGNQDISSESHLSCSLPEMVRSSSYLSLSLSLSDGDSGSLNDSFKLNNSSSKDRNGNQLQERSLNEEVRQRLVGLSTQLHALQAAVIRQDSILELTVSTGPMPPAAPGFAPGSRLVRSMSRDAALDASGEAVLLRRQVELLQEELSRLRLKAEECNKKASGSGKKKKKNKGKGDATKDQQ